jgi:hypothetical protein
MTNTTFKNIVEMAAARGSTATTNAGARRFLLSHQPAPIKGEKQSVFARSTTKAAYKAASFNRRIALRADKIAFELGFETKTALQRRIAKTLESSWAYRQATSRWAGGEHSVTVSIGPRPDAACTNERVWSSNGKWSGNNSSADLCISYEAVRLLGENGLVIGGLITLGATQVGQREYRAVWAKQGRGVSLTTQEGWIIRGYHSTAKTLELARKQAAKARAEAVQAALAVRASKTQNRVQAGAYKAVWVSLNDSLNAGNCLPASEQVRARVNRALGGEVFAVRGDVLLSLVTDSERSRAMRAIATASQRHAA